jgi:hypothetical protein
MVLIIGFKKKIIINLNLYDSSFKYFLIKLKKMMKISFLNDKIK